MPNYSYNEIAVKGNKQDVISFINDALKRAKRELVTMSSTEDVIAQSLEGLPMSAWKPTPKTFLKVDTTNTKRDFHRWAIYGDGFHRPDKVRDYLNKHYPMCLCADGGVNLSVEVNESGYKTILDKLQSVFAKDYQKYSDAYDKESKYQQDKYGVVGWYDYNLQSFGCKWDSKIDIVSFVDDGGDTLSIGFKIDTPWSMPVNWFAHLAKKYKHLSIAIFSHEESNAWCGYFDIQSNDWEKNIVDDIDYDTFVTQVKNGDLDDELDTEDIDLDNEEDLDDLWREYVNIKIQETYMDFRDFFFDL